MSGDVTDASGENYSFQKVIAVLAVTLLVIKFIAWSITSSMAIFTDAMESIVNVVAAFMGLYALYLSAQPADKSHPYGHGKVELISSFVEGVMIVTAGVLIVFEAIDSLIHPGEIQRLDWGLLLLFLTALANFVVGRMAIRKGRKNRSPALVASGKHLCSDTYSTVGVTVALLIMIGLRNLDYDINWLDSGIAIVLGLIIGITGIRVVRTSLDGFMDKTDDELVQEIAEVINNFRHDDWVDVHDLRVIKYGPLIHIDLHVMFPREMAVSELKKEQDEIYIALMSRFGKQVEVTLMGEPCTDVMCQHCKFECNCRTAEFVSLVEWSVETMTDTNEHHVSADVED
ncbi:MAG: cation transporter [Candidatus Methanomethylophilaceae archaeon]|nr:cation transporter [Candidatus Methanomethylophilaceae archaeon]